MTQHLMSGQRKTDLAKESKKHGSIRKKDKQGGLVVEIQGRKSFNNERECQMLQRSINQGRQSCHWQLGVIGV